MNRIKLYNLIVHNRLVQAFGFLFGALIPGIINFGSYCSNTIQFISGHIERSEVQIDILWSDVFSFIGNLVIIYAFLYMVYLHAKIQLTVKYVEDLTKKAMIHTQLVHWLDNIRFRFIKEGKQGFIFRQQEEAALRKDLEGRNISTKQIDFLINCRYGGKANFWKDEMPDLDEWKIQ